MRGAVDQTLWLLLAAGVVWVLAGMGTDESKRKVLRGSGADPHGTVSAEAIALAPVIQGQGKAKLECFPRKGSRRIHDWYLPHRRADPARTAPSVLLPLHEEIAFAAELGAPPPHPLSPGPAWWEATGCHCGNCWRPGADMEWIR